MKLDTKTSFVEVDIYGVRGQLGFLSFTFLLSLKIELLLDRKIRNTFNIHHSFRLVKQNSKKSNQTWECLSTQHFFAVVFIKCEE